MKTIIVLFFTASFFSSFALAEMPTEAKQERYTFAAEQKKAQAGCKEGFGLPNEFSWLKEMNCRQVKIFKGLNLKSGDLP